MESWVIGDVHGCFGTLQRLVARLPGPHRRRLLMVGDLVNRGPSSLEILRWAVNQPDLVVTLGNHDLHLLARAEGLVEAEPGDTLDGILDAPDRDELLAWLRRQPLLHRVGSSVLVHAGVCPSWGPAMASEMAQKVSRELAGAGGARLLDAYVRRQRNGWRCDDDGRHLATVLSVVSGVRTLDAGGAPCHEHTGPPETAPDGYRPWFSRLPPSWSGLTVFFGHWAALGFRRLDGVVALDSGCVYGGHLTAVRVEDGVVVQEPLAPGDRAVMDGSTHGRGS